MFGFCRMRSQIPVEVLQGCSTLLFPGQHSGSCHSWWKVDLLGKHICVHCWMRSLPQWFKTKKLENLPQIHRQNRMRYLTFGAWDCSSVSWFPGTLLGEVVRDARFGEAIRDADSFAAQLKRRVSWFLVKPLLIIVRFKAVRSLPPHMRCRLAFWRPFVYSVVLLAGD